MDEDIPFLTTESGVLRASQAPALARGLHSSGGSDPPSTSKDELTFSHLFGRSYPNSAEGAILAARRRPLIHDTGAHEKHCPRIFNVAWEAEALGAAPHPLASRYSRGEVGGMVNIVHVSNLAAVSRQRGAL